MMKFLSLRKSILLLAVTGFSAMSLLLAWNSRQSANLRSLFDGPVTDIPHEPPEYYPALRYQVSGPVNAGAPIWEHHTGSTESPDRQKSQPIPRLVHSGRPIKSGTDAESVYYEQSNRSPDALQLRIPSVYLDRRPSRTLQITHPEDRSVFPPNLCPPYVEWDDSINNLWMVCIQFGPLTARKERSFIGHEKRWRFPKDLWNELKNPENTHETQLCVKGIRVARDGSKEHSVQASETVHFTISTDPADNFLVYRIVSPPFSTKKTPDLRIRDIRKDNDELFLSSRRQYCINCHTFSSKQGNRGKFSVQVRCLNNTPSKLKTYLAVYDLDARKGKKIQLPFIVQMSTFMAWSPDGSNLAFSANQKLATLYPITYETQLAGTLTADLAIYNDDTETAYLLPGASAPSMLENYPYWSPDGQTLVFARTPVGQHPARMLYGLYAIPFGNGVPGDLIPVEDASDNGRSNVYPRFSPDGKWFSFCQCDGGDLIRSSSDLYIKAGDLQGPARRLECNSEFAADSWHSWSSNSRWIVFTSKRTDGTFSYLYFTHIDDDGHASPGVRLPEETPPLASYNIPESTAERPPVLDQELFESLRVEREPVVVLQVNFPDRTTKIP